MFATFRCFEGFSGPRLQVHHFGAYSVHCYPCYTLVLRARFDVRTEQYRAKFPLCIGLHLHSFTHICRSAPLSTKTFLTVCRLFCLKTAAPIMARPGRTARPYHPTVGPFTVLKFKDQNFISNIYYRKGPSFTTVSRCVRSLAGHPNFTAHFQRAPLLLQQYQGEGNTGVVMFQKSSNIFSSCFILSWKRLL